LQVLNHQSQVGHDYALLAICGDVGSEECILNTRIIRFLKPTKLGADSEPWLRHDVRDDACVAKTWRYLRSRMRFVVLLAFCSVVFPRYKEVLFWGVSSAEEEAIWVIVAITGYER
jgi:hypothetical protein